VIGKSPQAPPRRISANLLKALHLAGTGNVRALAGVGRRWLYTDDVATGYAYDAGVPLKVPSSPLPLRLRELRPDDVDAFTRTDLPGLSPGDLLVRVNARHVLESDLRTPYVLVTEDDEPCYLQYLVFPEENERMREVFGGLFPPLAPNEALLEFAFTLEKFRGRLVMPFGFSELSRVAAERGATRVLCYVSSRQQAMSRFLVRAGFEPVAVREERRRLLHRRLTFRRAAS
jgi:hypothetical protein